LGRLHSVFQFYVDKTLILSETHCLVLELNDVVIGLSGKGRGFGFMFAFNENSSLSIWFS
jgi:hypothetical protein